jgi:hypothetical protein
MTITPIPNPVVAGQIVRFEGVVANAGPDTATNLQFRVPGPFPNDFELVSMQTEPAVPCTVTVGTVVCNVAILPVGQSVTFRVALRTDLDRYGPVGGYFEGGMEVQLLNQFTIDPNENNVAAFALRILPAQVAVPLSSFKALVLLSVSLAAAAVLRMR